MLGPVLRTGQEGHRRRGEGSPFCSDISCVKLRMFVFPESVLGRALSAFSSRPPVLAAHLSPDFLLRWHPVFRSRLYHRPKLPSLPPHTHPRHVCICLPLSGALYSRPVAIHDNCSLETLGTPQIPLAPRLHGRSLGIRPFLQFSCCFLLRVGPPAWPRLGHRRGFLAGLLVFLSVHAKTEPHLVCLVQGPANLPPTFTVVMPRRLNREAAGPSAQRLQP